MVYFTLMQKEIAYPIFDMHCDLLSYLIKPGADAYSTEDIPCAIPFLKEGKVKTQVCAIYTGVGPESMESALRQADKFRELIDNRPQDVSELDLSELPSWGQKEQVILLPSIENAAGFGTEDATWNSILHQFDSIIDRTKRLAYISLTHHTENRFGGGNYSEGIGLKVDGKKLLDLMDGKKIPVDLSHTSDLLAEGILNHINKENLDIPVIASHSNFRSIWSHPRNISDEFAKEVIHRKGLIGVNFLRAFLDNEFPERLYEHLMYGFKIGGEESICFGADFFATKDFPDPSRFPFYFPLAENASKYQGILEHLSQNLSDSQLNGLSHLNALNFYKNLWT